MLANNTLVHNTLD